MKRNQFSDSKTWSRREGESGRILKPVFIYLTPFKRELGAKLTSYSKLDLPGAPQSAHRLLCGCFTSSSRIFLLRSWFAISTQSRRLLSHDRVRRRHWAWCYHRLKRDKTGTFLLFGARNELPPNFRHRQQAPRSRVRRLLTPPFTEECEPNSLTYSSHDYFH